MKFKTKYFLCLQKRYFDVGYGLTSPVKWLLAVLGISSRNILTIIIIAFFYAFFCYFFGMFWFRKGFAVADQEVSNQYNLFVKELRKRKP